MKIAAAIASLLIIIPLSASAGTVTGSIGATIVSPVSVSGASGFDMQRRRSGVLRFGTLVHAQPGTAVSVTSDSSVMLSRSGSDEKLALTGLAPRVQLSPDSRGNTHLALQGRLPADISIHAGTYTGQVNIMMDYQ